MTSVRAMYSLPPAVAKELAAAHMAMDSAFGIRETIKSQEEEGRGIERGGGGGCKREREREPWERRGKFLG